MRPNLDHVFEAFPEPIKVLDHGFVRLVDLMGDDRAIEDAARVSYAGHGQERSREETRNLLRYMLRHNHGSPFEMVEFKAHVKLPIFVARQWIRHRMSETNEMSARYSILDREFYVPALDQIAVQSTINKQGRGEALDPAEAEKIAAKIYDHSMVSYDVYQLLLNDVGDGTPRDEASPQLARELARMNLSLNHYTQWYWKVNLRSLFNFLNLRMDSHAQYEIRVYADAIAEIVKVWVPIAFEAFEDYVHGARTLSRMEIRVVKTLLHELRDGELEAGRSSGMLDDASALLFRKTVGGLMRLEGCSVREIKEFMALMDLEP